mgnify:FL=1
MYKLNRFKEQISKYKKLSMNEAKELLVLANNTADPILKEKYINEVILGTLYIVYNFILSNDYLINSKEYDMDDIISVFCEVWIRYIKKGKLLDANNFSSILLTTFLAEVSNLIAPEEIYYLETFGISKEQMVDLFKKYIVLKNNNVDVKLNDLTCDTFINKYIITIFDNIYKKFDFSSDKEISRNKIYGLFQMFISSGLKEKLNKNLVDETSFEEEMINDKFYSDFNVAVEKILPDIQRDIINKRFGFDGEAKTLEEVASTYGVTKENIRQIEAKALKKLRRTRSIIQFSK